MIIYLTALPTSWFRKIMPSTIQVTITYSTVEWLSMCSELEQVQITPSKYDEGLLYCGNAWDYSVSKSAISSQLTTVLVQFLFAWGALESLIKATVPNKHIKKYGKIHALCSYFKEHNLNRFLPNGYLCEYERMVTLLRGIPGYKDILINLGMEKQTKYSFKSYVDVDISGVGVYVVSKISILTTTSKKKDMTCSDSSHRYIF